MMQFGDLTADVLNNCSLKYIGMGIKLLHLLDYFRVVLFFCVTSVGTPERSSQVPKFPSSEVPKFLEFQVPKFPELEVPGISNNIFF